MKRTTDTLVFTPEMGRRLRALRFEVGYTQAGLAKVMGRPGHRTGTLLSRLERGEIRYPSLALVADYLRACRAGFGEVLDLLDRYTRRRTVVDALAGRAVDRIADTVLPKAGRQVQSYDVKFARSEDAAGVPAVDPMERLKRARNNAAAARRWSTMHTMLMREVNHAGVRPTYSVMHCLAVHGHKVFAILYRTQRSRPGRREEIVAKAEEWMLGQEVVPLTAIQYITGVTLTLFRQMEVTGELGWRPDWGLEDLDKVLLTPQRRKHLRKEAMYERRAALTDWVSRREVLIENIWQEALPLFRGAGVEEGRLKLYRGALLELCSIVDHAEPESEQARDQVESCVTNERRVRLGMDSSLSRQMAAIAVPRYEELRRSLPPHPAAWVRPTAAAGGS